MLWCFPALASEWVTVPTTDEDRGVQASRCAAGEADACWLAGASWLIAEQPDRAEPLLDKGCMGRSLDACLVWGNLHLTGEVSNADPARAAKTLGLLCTQLGPACYELARSGASVVERACAIDALACLDLSL